MVGDGSPAFAAAAMYRGPVWWVMVVLPLLLLCTGCDCCSGSSIKPHLCNRSLKEEGAVLMAEGD